MAKYIVIILILWLMPVTRVCSQIAGTATYQFLNMQPVAAYAALGGTNISLPSENKAALFTNAALQQYTKNNWISVNYIRHVAAINWGAVAWPMPKMLSGNFSMGLQYVNYGKFEGADMYGIKTGQFSAAEYALYLTWSKAIDSVWFFGGTFKPILSQMEMYYSAGVAIDLALAYINTNNRFSAGLVMRNLGYQFKRYNSENNEKLPFQIMAGITIKPEHAPFRISVTATNLQKADIGYINPVTNTGVHLQTYNYNNDKNKILDFTDLIMNHIVAGLEIMPEKNLSMLAGFNYLRRSQLKAPDLRTITGFSWGITLNLPKLKITYAHPVFYKSQAVNQISVTLNTETFVRKQIKNTN